MSDKKTKLKVIELSVKLKALCVMRDSVEKFAFEYPEDGDPDARFEIPVRLERLDHTYNEFMQYQSQIEVLDEPEMLTTHLTERADFEKRYCATKGFLLSKRPVDPVPTQAMNSTLNTSFQHQHSSNFHLRLPKIDLPKFDGDFSKWLSFRDTFSSMVHSSTDIPTVAKLQYLLQSLVGAARTPYESIDIEADRYAEVWDSLLKRYDNQKFLKKQLFRVLYELPPVKKESAKELNELVDEFQRHVKALEKLKEPIAQWDTPLIYLLSIKLDPATMRAWEEKTVSDEYVKYDALIDFLYNRVRILKSVAADLQPHSQPVPVKVAGSQQFQKRSFPSKIAANAATSQPQNSLPPCIACPEKHFLFRCPAFAKLPVAERRDLVTNNGLCWNCFRSDHVARWCKSKFTCQTCHEKHHTLLHMKPQAQASSSATPVVVTPSESQFQSPAQTSTSNLNAPSGNPPNQVSLSALSHVSTVLLETVAVQVVDDRGNEFQARALLDSGSMLNFISKKLAQQLSTQQEKVDVAIAGIGQSQKKLNRTVSATVRSRTKQYAQKLEFLIIDDPTANLPTMSINRQNWNLPKVPLADPEFHRPGRIDLVIGGETYWALHTGKKISLGPDQPQIVETQFGWTVSGPTSRNPAPASAVANVVSIKDRLEAAIQRFWEVEEIPTGPVRSIEEKKCEKLYAETTNRNSSGRYVVRLPKKDDPEMVLGESREIAVRRFLSTERRLERNPAVHEAYHRFMEEYEELNHMRKIPEPVNDDIPHCYLPHHPVFKASSTTTKTRVVFDASCKTASGKSLNDLLLVGPVVQDDLLSLTLRFRTRPIALVADVEKMYRQIQVHPEDCPLQRILWRSSPSEPISSYELLTVTYGTASAPYLATRTLQQIATDARGASPVAAEAIANDFYVDDLLSGAADVQSAIRLRREVSAILSKAGFPLKKWVSNSPEVLRDIPKEDQAIQQLFDLQDPQSVSTLGLIWEPKSDTLQFKVDLPLPAAVLTKRLIMSYIATIFDPLGLLGPTITRAKLYMQGLWALKDVNLKPYEWDTVLPQRLQAEWKKFHTNLELLRQVRVSRYVIQINAVAVQLLFFADASEKAYGACCYVRSESPEDITMELLTSKSKVAPLSVVQPISRLELDASELAVRLHKKVKSALKLDVPIFFFSDSTCVLQWLQSPASRWKPYVGNRVSKIQEATDISSWYHVAGMDNPADDISRGLDPADLLECVRFWKGPNWSRQPIATWRKRAIVPEEAPETIAEERKVPLVVMAAVELSFWEILFQRYSNYTNLKRAVAAALRYIEKIRKRIASRVPNEPEPKVICEPFRPLTTTELQEAERFLCRIAQRDCYAEELSDVAGGELVTRSSTLKWLSPTIDQHGLLRVGGRLSNAKMSENAKHPIVLPANHPLSVLLARHYHEMLLHAGPQLMLVTMRQRFWILGARNLVRQVYHRCDTCFRSKPVLVQQSTADLPTSRVSPTRPFSTCGVDYCGPLYVKSPVRKHGPRKVYVAIYICFSTRAVHIELVSDLTTAAFLAALRRVVARRGKILELHSDNGTAFKGASHELHRVYRMLKVDDKDRKQIFDWCANNEITWKFIPPRAPHFGGLWEAAVKSAKTHLLKELRNSSVAYEDMLTLLAQVEMCLNSRPLTPLSTDPTDLEALTPGHFLIGSSFQAVPEKNVKDTPDNRLTHWEQTQKQFQRIWSRWYPEYLQQLQTRASKGCKKSVPIEEGRIVIVKDDNLPPTKWPLGRITKIHPGKDGVVRIVTLKTASSEGVIRPVARIAILPLPNDPVSINNNSKDPEEPVGTTGSD